MADDAPPPNSLLPVGGLASVRVGDVPDRLKARYYVEDHGRAWRFFVDARVATPALEDRGRRLLSRRADPNVVRDLIAIADHRGWRRVEARGAPAFRREAWLAGRAAGLEVRGYRPTTRDLQDLDRRRSPADRTASRGAPEAGPRTARAPTGAVDRLRVVETVVRSRLVDPAAQAQLLAHARQRIADWLERGARFEPLRPPPDLGRPPDAKERRRAR